MGPHSAFLLPPCCVVQASARSLQRCYYSDHQTCAACPLFTAAVWSCCGGVAVSFQAISDYSSFAVD